MLYLEKKSEKNLILTKTSSIYSYCSLHIIVVILYNVRKGEIKMDIIKISNDAIKISLGTEETKKYGFASEKSADNIKARLLSLLFSTEEKLDFRISNEKITGEIFLGNDGCCEIFVARAEAQNKVYKDRLKEELAGKAKQEQTAFSLQDLDSLLTISKRLKTLGYIGACSVYYDINGKYYIILEDVSIKDLKYSFMSEFSKPAKNNLIVHIKEHYKCICKKNTINILSSI